VEHLVRQEDADMNDLALLTLRLTTGGLLMGHGAQKLFGWFGGYGIEGTAGWLESLGLRPGRHWARLAGASELGGGALTALGLASPLGPVSVIAAMGTATAKAHWGKPIWVTSGGAELPVTNIAVATALALAGPGRYSLDRALGIRIPLPVALLVAAAAAGGVALAASQSAPQTEQPEEAVAATQGGEPTTQEGEPAQSEQTATSAEDRPAVPTPR
jgi:putative oxidoreductase